MISAIMGLILGRESTMSVQTKRRATIEVRERCVSVETNMPRLKMDSMNINVTNKITTRGNAMLAENKGTTPAVLNPISAIIIDVRKGTRRTM